MSNPSTPSTFPPPVNPNDLGRGPMVMGLTWTFTGLAIITTLLRLYVRKQIAPRLGTDDWLMLVAMLFQLVAQIFVSISFKYGMGKHLWDISQPDELVAMSMWDWFSVPPGLVSGIFGRISICVLLIRLFGVNIWFRYYAMVLTALGVMMSIVVGTCIYAENKPVQALWDPYIPNSKQWNPSTVPDLMFLGQALYALADLTFVIFPVIIVSKLHMSLRRRLGLIALMTLSLFTCGMSIMKGVSAIAKQAGSDATYTSALSLLWATVEQACVVLLGNIVPLRAVRKLEIPSVLSTLGNSVVTLLGQSTRADSKSSAVEYHNGTYEDIEMNTHGLGGKPNAVWHELEDHSKSSFRRDGLVKRTDSFTVTYTGPDSPSRS
ncbi:hypothetical protein F4804DRAFT_327117 [Jackrogersella minutella]|nr:hypothetical protein F4804DRAFT_327117 [Jackrogersella minutella]